MSRNFLQKEKVLGQTQRLVVMPTGPAAFIAVAQSQKKSAFQDSDSVGSANRRQLSDFPTSHPLALIAKKDSEVTPNCSATGFQRRMPSKGISPAK